MRYVSMRVPDIFKKGTVERRDRYGIMKKKKKREL
jgi:hypothetical protein